VQELDLGIEILRRVTQDDPSHAEWTLALAHFYATRGLWLAEKRATRAQGRALVLEGLAIVERLEKEGRVAKLFEETPKAVRQALAEIDAMK
jgi:hypothetical protein